MAIRRQLLDRVGRTSGRGESNAAMTNIFRGINHRSAGNPVPSNTDNYGLTFFTRPRLNLSYDNITTTRTMSNLIADEKMSMQRAIRVLLDPVGADVRGITTPLVDNRNPFMTVLSNNLLNMSGWPDFVVDTYVSEPGINNEVWSMVDGYAKDFGSFDLTATFKNIQGDPITAIFYIWTQYALMVQSGAMMPYPEVVVENEIDYQTRIYRLVLDKSRRYVQKFSSCAAAFPIANPLGAAFNFDSTSALNRDNDQISVPFRCVGPEYNDPITIVEFNKLVKTFCPALRDENIDDGLMVKLKPNELGVFNYEGFPLIAGDHELEWWVDTDTYQSVMQDLLVMV